MFLGIPLPCWFAESTDINIYNNNSIKSIWIHTDKEVLRSPSDEDYRKASKLKPREIYKPDQEIQKDYAILLRLTIDDKRIVVIAGIHQYGTWIGVDFFEKIVRGECSLYRKEFLSQSDIIAIISGGFNSTTLKTHRCGVWEGKIWARNNDSSWTILEHS